MARFQLNAASGGINRQRVKGGPKPDNLYDILNGYVDASGAVLSRPGTSEHRRLPPGTVGMCAFDGGLVVFSHQVVNGLPRGVRCEVLTHPDDRTLPLSVIHYAGPFLGALFVTVEFVNGDVFDFWLQRADNWRASAIYQSSDRAQPSNPNGFVYEPTRAGAPGVVWQPGVERRVGDVVEPPVANGYEYVVVEAIGAPPRSGQAEPAWIAQEGAAVIEQADVPVQMPPGQTQPQPGVPPRYSNPGGSTPRDSGSGNTYEQLR
ncbi:hypothetical protein ABE488_00715 [Luteimonas sp. TWI662]|uniref:hypothetical protein n=1 Tax=Luteimonas sp. TWI662 TaxID=3136789 RepID=UPI0032087771